MAYIFERTFFRNSGSCCDLQSIALFAAESPPCSLGFQLVFPSIKMYGLWPRTPLINLNKQTKTIREIPQLETQKRHYEDKKTTKRVNFNLLVFKNHRQIYKIELSSTQTNTLELLILQLTNISPHNALRKNNVAIWFCNDIKT